MRFLSYIAGVAVCFKVSQDVYGQKRLSFYGWNYKLQSTTSITDFFVVGKMSGVLVGFVILVGHSNNLFRL